MKTKILIGSLFVLFASAAFAQPQPKSKGGQGGAMPSDARRSRAYRPAYGMAGCGLGSVLFKENTMVMQLSAATTNDSSYRPSAITTGTSNCSDKGAEQAALERKTFVASNLNTISKEAAQGGGQHLTALADVFGCREALPEFNKLSQQNYEVIFASRDVDGVIKGYLSAIKTSKTLASTCERAF